MEPRGRSARVLLLVLAVGALFAGPVMQPAGAVPPQPVLSIADATIPLGAMMHVAGSGCVDTIMVAVVWTRDPGTPDEDVLAIDFPIVPDVDGTFSSSASSATLEVGTMIDVVAFCGAPGTEPRSETLALTIVEPETCGAEMDGPFTDVRGDHPFCDEIAWLVQEGVTTGFPDGGFHPAASVTRQSMAAFLYRFAGEPDGPDPVCVTAPFTDVSSSHPFCGEIAWLVQEGVTTGFPDGGFHPAASVSRQADAAFMYRFAGEPDGADPGCATAPFTDVAADHPFCGEIDWLVGAGITTGYPDDTFRPANTVSRQAMAAFLQRLSTVV